MIEVLEFVFRSPWTFAGCVTLAVLILGSAIQLAAALAKLQPFFGLVMVHNPSVQETTIDDHGASTLAVQPKTETQVDVGQASETRTDSPSTRQKVANEVRQSGVNNQMPAPEADCGA